MHTCVFFQANRDEGCTICCCTSIAAVHAVVLASPCPLMVLIVSQEQRHTCGTVTSSTSAMPTGGWYHRIAESKRHVCVCCTLRGRIEPAVRRLLTPLMAGLPSDGQPRAQVGSQRVTPKNGEISSRPSLHSGRNPTDMAWGSGGCSRTCRATNCRKYLGILRVDGLMQRPQSSQTCVWFANVTESGRSAACIFQSLLHVLCRKTPPDLCTHRNSCPYRDCPA
jgi:hypothetical protein